MQSMEFIVKALVQEKKNCISKHLKKGKNVIFRVVMKAYVQEKNLQQLMLRNHKQSCTK